MSDILVPNKPYSEGHLKTQTEGHLNNRNLRDRSYNISQTFYNRQKNRYYDILPPDNTLVKLKKCEEYINANYVNIAEGRWCIVTQAPLLHTIHDFWTMVIDSGADTIIALAPLVEGTKAMTSAYWPLELDTRVATCLCKNCPEIRIEAVYSSSSPSIEKTILHVYYGQKMNVVTHYHYAKWKDFSIPDATELLSLVKEVKNKNMIVHCTAGAGRSGVFVTCLRCMISKENPDIALGTVRQYRPSLVQTDEQYSFIVKCFA